MIDGKAPAGPKLSKQQRYTLVGVAIAVLLIFAGVFLHVIFPAWGQTLEPAPAVSYPSDVGENGETIPPEVFDEGDEGTGDLPTNAAPL